MHDYSLTANYDMKTIHSVIVVFFLAVAAKPGGKLTYSIIYIIFPCSISLQLNSFQYNRKQDRDQWSHHNCMCNHYSIDI